MLEGGFWGDLLGSRRGILRGATSWGVVASSWRALGVRGILGGFRDRLGFPGTLGTSLGRFGGVLWRLGAAWGRRAESWGVLGRFGGWGVWVSLEVSWGGLGWSWAASGVSCGVGVLKAF